MSVEKSKGRKDNLTKDDKSRDGAERSPDWLGKKQISPPPQKKNQMEGQEEKAGEVEGEAKQGEITVWE